MPSRLTLREALEGMVQDLCLSGRGEQALFVPDILEGFF